MQPLSCWGGLAIWFFLTAQSIYLLGKVYCNGLGVPMDIARGVEYFQKAGDEPEARSECCLTVFDRFEAGNHPCKLREETPT